MPGDSIAKVGSVDIKKKTFDHLAQVAFKQQQGQAGAATTAKLPVPPEFKDCIAGKLKSAPKPAKGQPDPSEADFKKQCKAEYDALRDSVVSFLINAEWLQGEAFDRGIKLSDEEVRKALVTQKAQAFPDKKSYDDFIKQTGYTTEDLLFRVKVSELTNKLRTDVTKDKKKVTDKDLRAYYDKNKAQFGTPATRDLRIVLTKTEAKAKEAKAAIEGGQSFSTVAKRFSTDATSKNQGGALAGITQGQLEAELDRAAFKAEKGALSGPVKTQFGYYIFEVTKITAGTSRSFDEVKAQITPLVQQQLEQDALNKFVKDFTKKWTEKTDCRDGFKTVECKGAPKTSSTSTVPPGAVPQTQAPAGADGTPSGGQ
ncbi:MAG TPA: peptidyl-prolyl cis-trans isomerase [Baekduia sp.]|nr:peptidyl-prolyl cis-trans isomerase [Baekduia sp.]